MKDKECSNKKMINQDINFKTHLELEKKKSWKMKQNLNSWNGYTDQDQWI